MSETIRGIITDCVAGISILLVLGAAFFIYDLGLQHIYQELHELRAELSSVKQRNENEIYRRWCSRTNVFTSKGR